MTSMHQDDPYGLKRIGRIVANKLHAMAAAMEPGMTTRELYDIGQDLLEREGAVSGLGATYGFPGATCISVNEEITHGSPGERRLLQGDLVNIDVSASRDGLRAMEIGIARVGYDKPLAGIGNAIGAFASSRGNALIRNLASHGGGRALHEAPEENPTLAYDRRPAPDAQRPRLTVEPFPSRGGHWAASGVQDEWTLYSEPATPVVQYEHTLVATRRGAVVVALPG